MDFSENCIMIFSRSLIKNLNSDLGNSRWRLQYGGQNNIFLINIFKKSLDFAYFRLYLNKPALFRIPFLLLPPSGSFPFEFLKLWFKFIISNFKNTVFPIFRNVTIIFHCWRHLGSTIFKFWVHIRDQRHRKTL